MRYNLNTIVVNRLFITYCRSSDKKNYFCPAIEMSD